MCLRLTYAEALLWKQEANALVSKAKASAASIPCDPLFTANRRLSSLVSEIDSIKKRHGYLIEKALIFAINKLPNWTADKEKINVQGGLAHLDCLAYNSKTRKLYVFECKRGHGRFDSDKKRSIDRRLDRVKGGIASHASSKGWSPSSTELFLLSFYGVSWTSRFPIYNKDNVGKLFGPCVKVFLSEYMQYIEVTTNRSYHDELAIPANLSEEGTDIFDRLDEHHPDPRPDLLFEEKGCCFVTAKHKEQLE